MTSFMYVAGLQCSLQTAEAMLVCVEKFSDCYRKYLYVKAKKDSFVLFILSLGTQGGFMQERPCESFVSLELQESDADAIFGELLLKAGKAAAQHCSLS